jgi:hypothetical protein
VDEVAPEGVVCGIEDSPERVSSSMPHKIQIMEHLI